VPIFYLFFFIYTYFARIAALNGADDVKKLRHS